MQASQQNPKSNLEILHLTNAHPDFYRLLGPFLARREICKELGSPVWDDNGKVWSIALDCKWNVLGFAAYIVKGKSIHFCSDFVLPDKRRNGVYSQLMNERLNLMPNHCRITATATHMSLHEYTKHGFKEKSKRGRFHLVELVK